MWSWRLLERLCVLVVCHVSSLEREVHVASLPEDVEMPRWTAMCQSKKINIFCCIVWTMSCVACAAVLLEPVSCPLLLVPRRAEAVAAMDVTQTQQQQCHFCKGDLEGVEGDDVTKWLCGHSAHTDCLQENCLRRGVPVPNNCPLCDPA